MRLVVGTFRRADSKGGSVARCDLVPTSGATMQVHAALQQRCSDRDDSQLLPAEPNRAAEPPQRVKLLACLGMLLDMRTCLWNPQPWSGPGLVSRMTYL